MHKDIKDLARRLRAQGWTVAPTRSHHVRFLSPAGGSTISASTPGDHRGLQNLRSRLRRLGAAL